MVAVLPCRAYRNTNGSVRYESEGGRNASSAAPFPTGPMRMAAALRTRVFFMAGLYRGGNRYEVRFEPLADFTALEGLARAERDKLVNDAVVRYARCLERHCRMAPDNFFNFHPFWR